MTELNHDDIRWRVSNTWDKGDTKMGMLVGYIDSRTAMEALDVLDPNWSTKMEPVSLGGEQGIRCTLIVNGVAREDVGVASNTEPLKGAFSDALKRAAVHFGVGRELYELPKIAVECIVDKRTGKAKGPKALPTFSDGRWSIDRQYGWVKYDREPEDQPEQRRGAKASSPNAAAPAPRTPEEEALLDELLAIPGMSKARASLLADAVGVEKGTRANAEQLRAMLARATQPGESAPSPVDPPEAGTLGPASGSTPLPDGSTAAATPAASAPLRAEPSAAPTMDDVLAVSGGEVIPAELQERIDKARAKGKKAQPQQESLAEALGAPER